MQASEDATKLIRPPRFFRAPKSAKKSRRNSIGVSGRSKIESFSKRNRVVLKAEIESFSKCPHTPVITGGPGRTRTCNQTVMSGLFALDGLDLSTLFESVHSQNSRLFTVKRSASGPRT